MTLVPRKLRADEIVPDERFKMAGCEYRIFETDTNEFGEVILRVYDITKRIQDIITLIVSPDTKFKVHHQI